MSKLEFITRNPPNAATALDLLDGRPLPTSEIYMRNNFSIPEDTAASFKIDIHRTSRLVSLSDLERLSQVEVEMVLECAGNGRIYMDPIPDGTPWNLGGVSPVTFAGVSLLDLVGDIPEDIIQLVFTGADKGEVSPEGVVNYQFSLDRDLWPIALVATRLGRAPLPHNHGGPFRLVVPGQYAMKSVKWLASITGVDSPFQGHFVGKYRYFGDTEEPEGAPVGPIQVRSVIAGPAESETMDSGDLRVSGSAWSGYGPIAFVEISIDNGPWIQTILKNYGSEYGPAGWEQAIEVAPGHHNVRAKATDLTGRAQPEHPRWNRNGYANNLLHKVSFAVGI